VRFTPPVANDMKVATDFGGFGQNPTQNRVLLDALEKYDLIAL